VQQQRPTQRVCTEPQPCTQLCVCVVMQDSDSDVSITHQNKTFSTQSVWRLQQQVRLLC
jgi:hypothetical protein